MSEKTKTDNPADYKIGNTQYTVTPVFGNGSETESIEDKIKRLILQDKKQSSMIP